MKQIVYSSVLSLVLLALVPIAASAAGPYAPDNTGINRRDRDSSAMTAGEQAENHGDLDLTRRIRRAIMRDSSLSFMAKNVKIVSANGDVTLRGPVRTKREKLVVASKARAIAGADHVNNELQVKTEK